MKININENFLRLNEKYLFSEINERVNAFKASGAGERIISLGIGDVSRPLAPSVASAMAETSRRMATQEGFKGYGDCCGELALREAISSKYAKRGVGLLPSEIFISDGAKSDLGNINDLLGDNETVICAPVYPVYFDSSVISGRRIRLLESNKENGFLPTPKELEKKPYVIYLCSPNNPSGAVLDRDMLRKWVNFALESGSLIVFDAAYEAYISDPTLPHSIFEIEDAIECAIEVCSFSKSAGFTGVRCGWTAIPSQNPLHKLWKRRQSTKFNGASYVSQMGAFAALSPQGEMENFQNIAYYMENARLLAEFLERKKIFFVGGVNAPYLWFECPKKMSSWQFFDYLLEKAQVVGTPGVGFGTCGEEFFRFSAFASRKDTLEAVGRIDLLF